MQILENKETKMKDTFVKVICLILFIIINTVTSININIYRLLEGTDTTILNFIISITFLVLWFLFSFYKGIKKERMFKKFIVVYWSINIFSAALIGVLLLAGFNPVMLLPFFIWFFGPLYGFDYILNLNIAQLILVTASLGILFSSSGYFFGLSISKKTL